MNISGYVYVHESCALWSLGVNRPSDPDLQSTGDGVIQAASKKCAYCSRLGGSVACTFNNCPKVFHLPCAAASGAFQDNKSYAVVCSLHLDQVSLMRKLFFLWSCFFLLILKYFKFAVSVIFLLTVERIIKSLALQVVHLCFHLDTFS